MNDNKDNIFINTILVESLSNYDRKLKESLLARMNNINELRKTIHTFNGRYSRVLRRHKDKILTDDDKIHLTRLKNTIDTQVRYYSIQKTKGLERLLKLILTINRPGISFTYRLDKNFVYVSINLNNTIVFACHVNDPKEAIKNLIPNN